MSEQKGEGMTTKQDLAARDWWRELGNLLGWRVYGWTYRSECTYRDSRGRCIELTGPQRDEIMAAIGQNPLVLKLAEALTKYAVFMEYDYPGDVPEPCGLICEICKGSIDESGEGHITSCILSEVRRG